MNWVVVPIKVERQGEVKPGPFPTGGWGVQMPVASRIIGVGAQGADLSVLTLAATNGVRVWHPLVVIPVGGGHQAMLGRTIGESFGSVVVPGMGVFCVFQDLPWPTLTVAAATAEGEA
jgi:hypothetical protein